MIKETTGTWFKRNAAHPTALWLFLVIILLLIFQERDLEVELGDDYILDLQSKKRFFNLICQAASVKL